MRETTFETREDEYLAAHFEWVLTLLEAQRCKGRPATRAARRRSLSNLRRYARRGLFPRNRVRRSPTPVFVDAAGVTCAVAQLMLDAGDAALVSDISRSMNLLHIDQMAALAPAALDAWAREHGLTVEELGLIQPEYCEGDPDGCSGCCEEPNCLDSCPCVEFVHEDGTACYESGDGDGICVAGACDVSLTADDYFCPAQPGDDRCIDRKLDPECADSPRDCKCVVVNDESCDGCAATAGAQASASLAPLLAALFLLAARRRAPRVAS